MGSKQFSLGRLFYTVTLFSIAFALLGPAIRSIGSESRWTMLASSAVQFGLFAFVASRTVSRRNKVLSEAGKLIHRTSTDFRASNDPFKLLSNFARIIPLIALQAVYLWMKISPATMILLMANVWVLLIQMVALGLAAEAVVSMYFEIDQQCVEIHEHGFIYHGFYFQPWAQVTAVDAATHSSNRILVTTNDQGLGNVVQTVKTRPQERAENIRQMLTMLK